MTKPNDKFDYTDFLTRFVLNYNKGTLFLIKIC